MKYETLVELTADIASAHVGANSVTVDDVPKLIENVYHALNKLGESGVELNKPEPVISVRASVKKDYLVCLACGEKMKMLKRHLRTSHSMTPEEYREAFMLPADYPMVASEYANTRRAIAKETGLGRKPQPRRGRKKKPTK